MKLKLKRDLDLFEATIYGVGIILGAGIYALIGEAAGTAGNSVWMSFIIGATIASLTGLSYAELSAMYPRAAAEYVYVKKAYASKFLAFMIGWLIIFTGVVSATAVSLGFSQYFERLVAKVVNVTGIENIIVILTSMSIIGILSFFNFYGIKESSKMNAISTAIEIFGLLLIIFFGIFKFGSVDYFDMPFGMKGVISAASLIFFAYIGFEDIANLAEETKNPKKNMPRALIIAVAITTILYVLTSISAISLINWKALGDAKDPLTLAASTVLGNNAFLYSFIALFATSNTILVILIVTSRMMYGMSADGALPKILSKIHRKRRTPWIAAIAMMILSIIFLFSGEINLVAKITSLGAFITFGAVNLSLIWLRYTKPKIERPFKVPLNVGNFPILSSMGAAFCVFMILQFELEVMMMGLAVIIAGAVLYYIRRHKIIQSPLIE
jgi:APA family basic amino acid/polyamine antiporter